MSGSAPAVRLVVGAVAWANWTSVELAASYTTPADAWRVTAKNPSRAQLATLQAGAAVVVLVGTQPALRGTLERVQLRRTRGGGLEVELSGRDLAGALVDCSAPVNWSFRNLSLAAIAGKALLELGLSAPLAPSPEASTPRAKLKAEPGESYWQVLTRYAQKARLFVWMSPAGVLELGRPDYVSPPVARLVYRASAGQANILELRYGEDLSGRYTDVTVLGQAAGSASLFGAGAAQLKGTATAIALKARGLYRPLVIDDHAVESVTEARDRAAWEVSQQAFEAELLEVVVPGFGPTPTTLWAPNTQVAVEDEVLGVLGVWWVEARQLRSDARGARSVLQLRRPGLLLPPVAT